MRLEWSRNQMAFVFFAVMYWLGGMHLFMHNPGGSGFYLPFNMVGWLFASLMIGIGLWHITLTRQLVVSGPQGWLWAGLALMLVPLFTHADVSFDAGSPRFLGIAGGLLLLFALTQLQWVRAQRWCLLYVLLGAVAIEALFALVQYYLLTPGNWIGYNTIINRPYGIFQKDSVLSSFMALGATIALFLLFADELCRRGWRLWLALSVLGLAALLIVVIQSRSGQGGLLLSSLILLPLLLWQRGRVGWLACSVLLLGLLLGGLSFALFSQSRGLGSYIATIDFRLLYWQHCLEMFWQHPLLGVGYGKFESAFVDSYYAIPVAISGKEIIEANLDHPHNEILYWMVEGGLLALCGLLAMLFGWVRMLMRARSTMRLALLALPLPLFFHAMVEYPFYHSTAHWLALIWLLWFTDAEAEQVRRIEVRQWLLIRCVALLIPLLTVPFMLTGLHTAWLVTRFERGGLQQPELLEQVINRVPWSSRFWYDVMSSSLILALKTNNQTELRAYVDWAREFVSLTPRANVYFNAALALDSLGQAEEARHWRAEGMRLFPADPLFKRAMPVPADNHAVSQAPSAANE